MNKRIRKKKQKQQEQIEQAITGLLEVVEEAQRKYWQLWVEESTKRFVRRLCATMSKGRNTAYE